MARLQADTGNIAAMLERAAAGGRIDELTNGVSGLVEYWRFTGFTQPALITVAEHPSPRPCGHSSGWRGLTRHPASEPAAGQQPARRGPASAGRISLT